MEKDDTLKACISKIRSTLHNIFLAKGRGKMVWNRRREIDMGDMTINEYFKKKVR